MFRRVFALVVLTLMVWTGAKAPVYAEEGTAQKPAAEQEPAATTTVDIRTSGKFNFLNVYRTDGRWVGPDVVVVRIPEANYTEASINGGYILVDDGHWFVLPELGLACGSDGARYASFLLGVGWTDGAKWSAGFSSGVGIPLNSKTALRVIIDPVDFEYRLSKRWGVGGSLTAIGVGGDWEVKAGPMVRYHPTDKAFVELRVVKFLQPASDKTEAQVRLNMIW